MPPIPERLATALADRYHLERELGTGGMATVYLAQDLKHHRPVAIKVLRPDLAVSLGGAQIPPGPDLESRPRRTPLSS